MNRICSNIPQLKVKMYCNFVQRSRKSLDASFDGTEGRNAEISKEQNSKQSMYFISCPLHF